jgi:hypothetical protein
MAQLSGQRDKVRSTRILEKLDFTRHFEGSSASAAPHRIWIGNFESGPGKTFGKVNRRALEEIRAVGIHQNFDSIALDAVITLFHMVKLHAILHSGTTAGLDENSEPFIAILRIFRD